MKNLIDLHLHLDGSLPLHAVRELADMQNIPLPKEDEELLTQLRAPEKCGNLNEYLKAFKLPLTLLQTEAALELASLRLCQELQREGLSYAEIRFAPQLHTGEGLDMREITFAVLRGIEKSGFPAKIILCCMRGEDNHKFNIDTVYLAKELGGCAVDLAGAEGLFKTKSFDDVFALARSLGVPFTIHAGEADGADSVIAAVKAGAKRIGHGVRAVESDEAMRLILERGVTLEMCPTSNFQTGACKSFKEYPLKKFLDMGIKVTLNTDNMTVSNTTLDKEYAFAGAQLGINETDLEKIREYASEAIF